MLVVCGVGPRAAAPARPRRLVADTVQGEYYYDESAGLVACLEKAIRAANRKLAAHRGAAWARERRPTGPVGIGVAVVRGNELYVATAGPVEAYLVRQAHLLTLPDPQRAQRPAAEDLAPRGLARRDGGRRLARPRLAERRRATLGPDELKDAWSRSTPRRRWSISTIASSPPAATGSDGALAIEAARGLGDAPARPARARPPAGAAGRRSPTDRRSRWPTRSAAAWRRSASGAAGRGAAAGSAFAGARRPAPGPAAARADARYRRVTPAATRREIPAAGRGRRARLRRVAAALGVGAVGRRAARAATPDRRGRPRARRRSRRRRTTSGSSSTTGPTSYRRPTAKAEELLKDAVRAARRAPRPPGPGSDAAPTARAQVVGGLDRLYGVVDVAPRTAFSFAAPEAGLRPRGARPGAGRRALRPRPRHEDGLPDRPQGQKAAAIMRAGQAVRSAASRSAMPQLLAVGRARIC